jgi:redox-sensitive bicupin YhaK (pirin superfamily)
MKTILRPAAARGHSQFGWLDSRHTFSFGEYHDPEHMNFRALRVINDDRVAAGQGFGTHPHRDAEIFSYVISGALEHRDSMGNGSVIRPGDFQYMSAGQGVTHSEFNPSPVEPVHFLQVWLTPRQRGGEPRYAEVKLGDSAAPDALSLVFSGDPARGVTLIRQDAELYFGRLAAGKKVVADPGRPNAWLHVIAGQLEAPDHCLGEGDGLALTDFTAFELTARTDSQFLLFALG